MAVEPIVRALYFTVPRATARRHLAVARLFVKHKPPEEQSTAQVELAAKRLAGAIKVLTQGFIDRHIQAGIANPLAEFDLDLFVDGLWIAIRERLTSWDVFQRKGAARLAALNIPNGFDYQARIDKADRAIRLRDRLFGETGTDFTRMAYIDQAEYMKTLWAVIDQENLVPGLVEFVDADFVDSLRDAHDHYVAMADRRGVQDPKPSSKLAAPMGELQRGMQNYMISLLAMINDDDPANVAMIRSALRPMDTARQQLERERTRKASSPKADAADDAAAELLDEELLVEKEIGVVSAEDEPGANADES